MPFRLSSWILAAAAVAAASEVPFRVDLPAVGLVYNSHARAVQLVSGIPGAAVLDEPVVTGIEWAAVAPSGRAAVVVKGGVSFLVPEFGGAWIPLEAAPPLVAAWNSDSSALVLASGVRAWICRGLECSPAGDLPAAATAAAVQRDGTAAVTQPDGVWRLREGAPPDRILAVESPLALTLAGREENDLAVAAGSRIFEIRDFAGAAVTALFPALAEPGSEFAAVAASEGGRRLWVLDRGARSLAAYDWASRTAQARLELDFESSVLERVPGGSSLLLRPGGGPVPFYFLDGGSQPRVYFVPAEVRQ